MEDPGSQTTPIASQPLTSSRRKMSDQISQTDLVECESGDVQSCVVGPKFAELLAGCSAKIIGTEKLSDAASLISYRLYDLCVAGPDKHAKSVKRRFSDFEWLFKQFELRCPGKVIPLLPEKSLKAKFGLETALYQSERSRQLERFLSQLLANPWFSQTELLYQFLTAELSQFRVYQTQTTLAEDSHQDYLSLEGLYNRLADYKRVYLEKSILIEVGPDCNYLNTVANRVAQTEALVAEMLEHAEQSLDGEEALLRLDRDLLVEASSYLEVVQKPDDLISQDEGLVRTTQATVEQMHCDTKAIETLHQRHVGRRTLGGSLSLRTLLDDIKDLHAAFDRRLALQQHCQSKTAEAARASPENRKAKEQEVGSIRAKIIKVGRVLRAESDVLHSQIKHRLKQSVDEYPTEVLAMLAR